MSKTLRFGVVLAAAAAFAFAAGSASAATIGTPTTAGPYVSWSSDGHGGIGFASIGYWGGGEPRGWSTLRIPIQVGPGGTLQFDWFVQSTDSPYWDPVNIYLSTPAGNVWFANAAGRTGGWVHAAASLAPYAGSTVTLEVDVYQDGFGDPTQAQLRNVTVGDGTPPVLVGTPGDRVVEATGPAGATVSYTAPTATDDTDPAPSVACAPASGTAFALGDTLVTCTARDASGNQATSSFTVTVRDTTAPVLTLPSNVTVDAAAPQGTAVSFAATATDLVDGTTSVICEAPSGSVFAVGVSTVRCSSTDAHGNRATGSFTVTVRSAAEMLATLAGSLDGTGPGKSLAAKVAAAQAALAAGDTATAVNVLGAFRNEVAAQSGKKLTAAQADSLSAAARALVAAIG